MSSTFALVSVDNVHSARVYYVRHGINPDRLFDYQSFEVANYELMVRSPCWSDEYFKAWWMLEQHFRPTPTSRHAVSYRIINLDNVYRLRDLWRDVPHSPE